MFNSSKFWQRLGLVLTLAGGVVAFIATSKENEETISTVTTKVLDAISEPKDESE